MRAPTDSMVVLVADYGNAFFEYGDVMRNIRSRKPNRLKNYDYSQDGSYFITICVTDKHCILWKDAYRGNSELSRIGITVKNGIENIIEVYKNVNVKKYVIMPNHIHLLLTLGDETGYLNFRFIDRSEHIIIDGRTKPMLVSTVINQLKGYTTKQLGFSIWQKSFHDHIVRNQDEYEEISRYIDQNPLRWQEDSFYVVEDVINP